MLPFIPQVFIEHLLFIRHSEPCEWGNRNREHSFALMETAMKLGRMTQWHFPCIQKSPGIAFVFLFIASSKSITKKRLRGDCPLFVKQSHPPPAMGPLAGAASVWEGRGGMAAAQGGVHHPRRGLHP